MFTSSVVSSAFGFPENLADNLGSIHGQLLGNWRRMFPLLTGYRGLMLPSPKLGVVPGIGIVGIIMLGGQMLGNGGQVTAN